MRGRQGYFHHFFILKTCPNIFHLASAILSVNGLSFTSFVQVLKYKQYYDYCNSNVDKFAQTLSNSLDNTVMNCFDSFIDTFNTAFDKCFKLETPKCTKRTMQNNPWITPGIITSINHCHKLYDNLILLATINSS